MTDGKYFKNSVVPPNNVLNSSLFKFFERNALTLAILNNSPFADSLISSKTFLSLTKFLDDIRYFTAFSAKLSVMSFAIENTESCLLLAIYPIK